MKIKISIAVLCGALFLSFSASAQTAIGSVTLTDEQHDLLYGAQVSPATTATDIGGFDIHQLGGDRGDFSAVPLINVQLKAATNLMQGNTLDLSASYQTVSIGHGFTSIGLDSYEANFSVSVPINKYLDFSQAIREKAELCPEKLIDKLIIDGAVGFNLTW